MVTQQQLKNYLPSYAIQGLKSLSKQYFLHTGKKQAEKIIKQDEKICLEIGSGPKKGNDGWKTLDLYGICDIYWDLLQPLPFPDNSITKIYSSHLLEHFCYPDLVKLLAECYRVLKPNGVFSVCVPNASIYIKGYFAEEFKPREIYQPAFYFNSKIDYINYVAYMGGEHRYMFDQENLLAILKQAGFNQVKPREFQSEVDLPARDWESIYAEAIK